MLNTKGALYRLKRGVNRLKGKAIVDDFDWDLYHIHYRGEHIESAKQYSGILASGDYVMRDGTLVKVNAASLPLHPNYRLLYETIAQLEPGSVLEIGCGGGDLLHNIGILLPRAKLYGLDRSIDQLNFLRERHPTHPAVTMPYDCTLPLPPTFPQVDLAYTQAVLMHIQTGNAHLVALANLFRSAARQVVLMENWTRHDFMGDVQKLHAVGLVPWSEVHFYYRDSEELRRPHIMIVSAHPLPSYKPLVDYSVLRDAVRVDR